MVDKFILDQTELLEYRHAYHPPDEFLDRQELINQLQNAGLVRFVGTDIAERVPILRFFRIERGVEVFITGF